MKQKIKRITDGSLKDSKVDFSKMNKSPSRVDILTWNWAFQH